MLSRPVLIKLGQALEAWVARGAVALLRRLGPVRSSNLGGALARTIGPLLPPSRTADRNLRRALPELDAAARRRVVRGVWDNLGRTVCELPHLAALGPTAAGPGWEVAGADIAGTLLRTGGPVLMFGGHIGNWEMLPPVAASLGLPFASVYRASPNAAVDTILRGLRDAANPGLPQFRKGARGARDALAHVRRGGSLGLLVDQKMNDGVEATFFGLPAMTANALAGIAVTRRLPVVGANVVRLGPARCRVEIDPPIAVPDTGDRAADVLTLTQAINDSLERWIRAKPEGWLWLHRRWKQ